MEPAQPLMCDKCRRPVQAVQERCDHCRKKRPADGWAVDARVGQPLLGSLKVIQRIGYGATGGVYLAEDPGTGDRVVVKYLHGALASEPELVKRFRVEAVVTKELNIPQVVRTFDFGRTDDGTPYLTMEYVPGTGLREAMGSGTMTMEDALEVMRQILMALEVAHKRCVIHRDLKPGNIILSRDPEGHLLVKILDFGFAKVLADRHDGFHHTVKVTRDRIILGTPHYMSPEQAKGAMDLDGRTDLYSLGVMLYMMMTGVPPFNSEVPMEIIQMHLTQPPKTPSSLCPTIPQEMDRIILKLLEKKPEDRYATASEVLADLDRLYPAGASKWNIEQISNNAIDTSDLLMQVGRYVEDSIQVPDPSKNNWPVALYVAGAGTAALAILTLWWLFS